MISEIKTMPCRYCGRKELLFNREHIEEKDGNVFWMVRCGNCKKIQKIWMIGEADDQQ